MSTQMAYQLAKMGKELKRDIERALVGIENAKVAGNASTAREAASVGTWYGGNKPGTSSAAGNFSTNGSPSATPAGTGATAIAGGTNRAYTEALLKAGLLKAFELGGEPETVMMTPSHKQTASAFAGVATNTKMRVTEYQSVLLTFMCPISVRSLSYQTDIRTQTELISYKWICGQWIS